jgi:hypothetical protein
MSVHDSRASFFRKPWVRVRNTTSTAIAPYSVMRIAGATEHRGEIVYTVAQPNSTSYDWYLVNGPKRIPGTGETTKPEGSATFLTTGGYVRYTGSTPTLGETWGPSNGSWEISTGNSGFYITGGVESVAGNEVVTAMQTPPVSSNSIAMAIASGTVAACDTATNDLLDPAFAGMPTQTAAVYIPASAGTWSVIEPAATIYNPNPFRYRNGEELWLKKSNNLWLIDKADEFKPRGLFAISATTYAAGATSLALTFSSPGGEAAGDPTGFGNVAMVKAGTSNQQIAINCPVSSREFRLSYAFTVEITESAGVTGAMEVSVSLGSHLVESAKHTSRSSTTLKIPFSGAITRTLSKDDTLTLTVTITATGSGIGAPAISSLNGGFQVDPMF